MYSNRYSCPILIKKWIFRTHFRKILKFEFHRNRPVGTELFHTYGRTDKQTDRQKDMTKLMVTFPKFFAKSDQKEKKKVCQTQPHTPHVHKNRHEFFCTALGFISEERGW